MTPHHLVPVHPAALRAWPWLCLLVVPGRIYVSPWGIALMARGDGGLDALQQGAAPFDRSIAADPTATRRPA